MRRLSRSIVVLAGVVLFAFPHASQAANLTSNIIPPCDQTQYVILQKSTGTIGPPQLITIFPEDYGADRTYKPSEWEIQTYKTSDSCTLNDLLQVFVNLFSWGLYIISVLALFFFFLGGGVLLLSGGSPERVKTGKTILVNTVIGLVIALGSWVIVNLVVMALNPDAAKQGIGYIANNQPWFKTNASTNLVDCTDPPEYPCKNGAGGSVVRAVQQKMLDFGCYTTTSSSVVNGIFDRDMLTAWKHWQQINSKPITNVLTGYDEYLPCTTNSDTGA